MRGRPCETLKLDTTRRCARHTRAVPRRNSKGAQPQGGGQSRPQVREGQLQSSLAAIADVLIGPPTVFVCESCWNAATLRPGRAERGAGVPRNVVRAASESAGPEWPPEGRAPILRLTSRLTPGTGLWKS
jgi:hypothetical protein